MATPRAKILLHGEFAGVLAEIDHGSHYRFSYVENYRGSPISLTLPLETRVHDFDHFPPFFNGLLPIGLQLEALLRQRKIDASDYFRNSWRWEPISSER